MDDTYFLNSIVPWLLGVITASFGYGIKGLIDYLWLKSPRISVKAMLMPHLTMPPLNGYRKYEYNLEIEIQNHSKNDAYGFEVDSIHMPTGLQTVNKNPSIQYTHVINDQLSRKMLFECSITLPVDESNKTKGASERMNDFGNEVSLKVSYKNQLGKNYKKTVVAKFGKKITIVNSIRVKKIEK